MFQILRNRRSMVVEWIPRGRSSDRGSIAPRSRFDRTAIVVFFHASPMPSDSNLTLQIYSEKRRKIGRCVAVRSRSCGLILDEDGLSSCRHVATGAPSDRHLLNRPIAHVLHLMIAWTRVHAITAVQPESNDPRTATRPAKQKPCGNIVPHGRNKGAGRG